MNAGVALVTERLGIGLPYIKALPAELYRSELLDFVEVTPEKLCAERHESERVEIEVVPELMERAQQTCADRPIVVHGVELSIGSGLGWNDAYLRMLDGFQERWPFRWHSEHLSFQTVPGIDGRIVEVGVPLPLPATWEAVDLVASRCEVIRRRYGVPFLLENVAHYLAGMPADPGLDDDEGLMEAIVHRSGSRRLLDLHNLYCNGVNHGQDAFAVLRRLDLSRVVELHIAGGSEERGYWMDAHNGTVPERVWELLEWTLPRCPNAAGVVFEIMEEHANRVGPDVILSQLERARGIWSRQRVGEHAAPT